MADFNPTTGAVSVSTDLSEVVNLFVEIGGNLNDGTVLFEDIISRILVPSALRTFDEEGPGWAPLKEKTVARKGHNAILYETGDLRESLGSDRGNQYSVRDVQPQKMTFGTDRPFAGVHQYGSTKRNIPARPFMVVRDEDMEKLVDMARDFYLGLGDYRGRNAGGQFASGPDVVRVERRRAR